MRFNITYLLTLTILLSSYSLFAQLDGMRLGNANEIVEAVGEIEFINEEHARYYERKRITILNAESEANLFYVHYNHENKILNLNVDLFDITGEPIRKVKKSEIRDVAAVDGVSIYSENRVKYIELNHAVYPYIVEFSYSQILKGISLASLPNWYFQESNTSAVSSSTFTIMVPDGQRFQHQLYNIDVDPQVTTVSNGKHYKWRVENLPAFGLEPYSLSVSQQLPVLRLTPGQFKIDQYSGSMQSWDAYGEFLARLWQGRDEISPELMAEVQTLTAAANSDAEKIALLYKFMQENKRYVSVQLGIGGWQPFPVDYVEEHGYGDCKALSNYMKAMLAAVDIASYPVIIKAGGHHPYEVEDDFVDPDFNHAILYVPSEDVWLECTSTINPPGYLGRFTNDRKVLLVTPEGGRLARTPKLDATDNKATESMEIVLAADGGATLNYQGELSGILHEDWRYYEYSYTEEEITDKIREKGKLPTLDFSTVELQVAPNDPNCSLAFSAVSTRYSSRAGKRLFVPLNLICPRTNTPNQIDNRSNPIVLPYGYTQEAHIKLQLPEGYRVESLPKPLSLETPFGTYDLTIEEAEGSVQVKRSFMLNGEQQDASAYDAFREFLQ